ncbi:MAG TPA: NAD(P)-dependent oxidoreductase [Gaiellaceae bacterium]|nr:NAD(P)-dependent oxidoreductase [Gaiellaceae bacterium]
MSRPRVHEAAGVPAEIEADLAEAFELVGAPEGADGVIVTPAVTVDAAFLDGVGPQLQVVANYAVGLDNLDLDVIRARGIVATNTPGVLTNATAEHAIALMLALLRRVAEGDRSLRRRDDWEWGPDFMVGESLEGKDVLVVGPGRIGKRVAELAAAHGARPTFAGRNDDLPALLPAADVVTLHCPLTPQTRHLVDSRALMAMKQTAVVVNTARGPVVDEAALVEALRAGTIAGAALDVFEHEPAVSEELLAMENVVLTPHIASATRETRLAMGRLVVSALRAVLLEGRTPPNAV